MAARPASGTDYYISSSGNDSHEGISSASAWRTVKNLSTMHFAPGDRIRFEGGRTFKGPLMFRKVGDKAGQPILIESYGEGRATIDGDRGSGIQLVGCEGFRIANLNVAGCGRKNGNEQGVGVSLSDCRHIVVDQMQISGFQRAGLEFYGSHNVSITYVEAYENGYAGISSSGQRSSNVYIGHCRTINNPGDPTIFDNHSGNGIVLFNISKVVIEYCESAGNGWDMPNLNHNGPVGIWCAVGADQVVIQYNISHDNASPWNDGGGFDFDGGTTNSIMQYNYAYSNKNYGFLLWEYGSNLEWSNNTVRYNISVNNYGQGELHIGASDGQQLGIAQIHNNLFYNDRNPAVIGTGAYSATDIHLSNNILIGPQGKHVLSGTAGQFQYEGNCYWGIDKSPFSFPNASSLKAWAVRSGNELNHGKVMGMSIDPQLINPVGFPKLTNPTDLKRLHDYFGLQADSPLRKNKGTVIRERFQIAPASRDFSGSPVPEKEAWGIGPFVYTDVNKA